MFSGLIYRLKYILLGLAAATIASGCAILGGASLLALFHKLQYGTGGVVPVTHSIMAFVFLTGIIMVMAALPAFPAAIAAEFLKIRHWAFYIFGGAVLSFVVTSGLQKFQATADFLFFIFAGMLGGAVYWRVAGRNAGNWQGLEAEPEENGPEE